MRSLPWLASAVAAVAAFAGATALAAQGRPSSRDCLLAWNAPANHPSRVRLLGVRPITGLELGAGTAATDTFTRGSTPTGTSEAACLLMVAMPGKIVTVIGHWRSSRVVRWSFGRPIPTTKPFLAANIRLLPDGRVTKIYRR